MTEEASSVNGYLAYADTIEHHKAMIKGIQGPLFQS